MFTPLLVLLAACRTEEPAAVPAPPAAERERLGPEARLVRASLSLRGHHPSADELSAVSADPGALERYVDAWVLEPTFGDIVKHIHAEVFLTRTDIDDQLPSVGLAAGYSANDIHEAGAEEPLELVRHVVMEGRPYTEIVTADYTVANEVVADLYGLDIDRDVSGWRIARWADGRPHAGVLSSSQLYRRHLSAGSNFHRLRANFIAEAFLCESFARRDLVVDGGVDLTDEAAVALAVRENPNCIACHQALDPLAATLWGFKRQIDARAVSGAYELDDCAPDPDRPQPPIDEGDLPTDYCYPLVIYTPSKEDRWVQLDLRPPGYYGTPVDDLADVGREIANDPRFAACAVRRFYGWAAQIDPEDVPLKTVAELKDTFVASGFDARALAKAVVLSDGLAAARPFVDGDAPLLTIRPEAYAATIERLTGFRWLSEPKLTGCGDSCWGVVDLAVSDQWGYRAMAGGIDSRQVMLPTHTFSPNKVLVTERLAAEAAAFVVADDFTKPADARRLLREVEPTTTDATAARAQIEALHHAVLGAHQTEPIDVDEALGLFNDAIADGREPATAWTLVVSLILQDPRLTTY